MVGARAKGIVATLRPIVGIVTIPWTLAMAMLAVATVSTKGFVSYAFMGGMGPEVVLVVLASYLGVTAGYAFNDYFDFELDARRAARVGGPPRPGRRRDDILAQGVILGGISLAIMLALGLSTFVFALIQVLCVLAYSAYAKQRTPYANLLVVAAVALMPVTVFSVFHAKLTVEALALAAVNASFEPGFTWAGVVRDTPTDKELGVPTFPAVHGIRATAWLILASWSLLALATVAMFAVADLGLVFLVVALAAAAWLLWNAWTLVRRPEPSVGGSTFLNATLWFWLFSLALIFDIPIHIGVLP